MNDVSTLARELVAIPSHEDERQAGDHIESWLREHTAGIVTRDDHGNVIARRGDGERSLALVGHHDVVPPDESQVAESMTGETDENAGPSEEYVVERRDGRLYGRGSADMKGAVAAAMCAFRDAEVAEGELVFASFVGEEDGGTGARRAIDAGFSPTYAIVGEGSTNYSGGDVTDVAIAHKGRRGSTITAAGSPAHASEPEVGENAIYRATDAIERVRSLAAPSASVLGQQITGSVVVTEIDGGSAWNVVPERCTITVDERTVPGDRAALESVATLQGISWTVDQDLPPMACRDDEFVDQVLNVASREQPNREPARVIKPHATDAGWLAGAGTQSVVCGPAEPGEAHTATESVSLDVLDRCYRIYRTAAEEILESVT